jgi:hypothetical protein
MFGPIHIDRFFQYGLLVKITGSLDFVHCPEYYIIENTTFRKLDLFPSSGEGREITILLFPLERVNLNHWTDETFFIFYFYF